MASAWHSAVFGLVRHAPWSLTANISLMNPSIFAVGPVQRVPLDEVGAASMSLHAASMLWGPPWLMSWTSWKGLEQWPSTGFLTHVVMLPLPSRG